ncbi:MAG: endonuclease/exonuclease/phosphatase family protein [Clostridia bacterium]|nr:endonuclease/exonuclease/phosphatase family protein [Clostridia bacterium]
MKLISFNTQHCHNWPEGKINYDKVADVIRDFDIICLNEMRGEGKTAEHPDQIVEIAKRTGIENHYFAVACVPQGLYPYGDAIFSKIPIISAETIAIPDPIEKTGDRWYETRCILHAELENGLRVIITHMGLNPDEQELAVQTVLPLLRKEKCILMGDFNVGPDNTVLSPIREIMYDTAELFDEEKLSYPSYDPEIKIDYIFASPDIKVKSADIPKMVVSDHFPHFAEIEL